MRKRVFLVLSIIVLLLLTIRLPFAQPLDSQNPVMDARCDKLQAKGITKGLYGLCVTFCQSSKAWNGAFSKEDQLALSEHDKTLLKKYNHLRNPRVDPAMPCMITHHGTCPAWSPVIYRKIMAVAASIDPITGGYDDRTEEDIISDPFDWFYTDSIADRVEGIFPDGHHHNAYLIAFWSRAWDKYSISYGYYDVETRTYKHNTVQGHPSHPKLHQILITPEAFAACKNDIDNATLYDP